jgi:hypothetical protein
VPGAALGGELVVRRQHLRTAELASGDPPLEIVRDHSCGPLGWARAQAAVTQGATY